MLNSWLRGWWSQRNVACRADGVRRGGARLRSRVWSRPADVASERRVEIHDVADSAEGLETRCLLSTFTVTNTSDSLPGSFRAAITSANANPGTDTIVFAIPGAGVQTIQPTSALPSITSSVIIDGYTQDGNGDGVPDASPNTLVNGDNANLLIELNGSLAGSGAEGLVITAGNSTVKGLVINGFQNSNSFFGGTGIRISTNGGNVIQGNFIGTDADGVQASKGNYDYGVFVHESPGNTIGGTNPADRNLISGNGVRGQGSGVSIIGGGANSNLVQGNYIGTDRNGTAALGNHDRHGVLLTNGRNNLIGGTTPGAGNLISGNNHGIQISDGNATGSPTGNLVQGNFIGTDVTGTQSLGNTGNGILLSLASNNTIGGISAAARNIISGNAGGGIAIENLSVGNLVQGNFIGTDMTGTVARPNLFGVYVESNNNTIGGTAAGAGNLISGHGNGGYGVQIIGSNTVVQGNLIGTDITGTRALGNTRGVFVFRSGINNLIGGTLPGAGNVIAGNTDQGILLQLVPDVSFNPSGAAGAIIQGNWIGTDKTGTIHLGSSQGVLIQSSNGVLVGGTAPESGNTIAFNSSRGVANHIAFHTTSIQDAILSNRIYGNDGLGIDLDYDGVTPNDVNDVDGGANNRQNFPVITSASSTGIVTTITGTLNSTANSTFRLQFFSSPTADSSGYGEGQTYLGSIDVTTPLAGNDVNYTVALASAVPVGHVITATATDITLFDHDSNAATAMVPRNNTSEFSFNRVVVSGNQAPVSNGDSFSVAEGGTLAQTDGRGTTTPGNATDNGVLANDTDADGNTLTAILIGGPANAASFTLNADGSFSYVHNGSETTSDSFSYRTNDGTVDGNVATVAITVTPVNDAPVLAPIGNRSTDEDALLSISVTSSDIDTPSNGLSLNVGGLPAGATFVNTGNGTGQLSWTPADGQQGTYSVTFTVSDNGSPSLSDSETITITVREVNDAPTAGDDSATVAEDSIGNIITVLANDTPGPAGESGQTLTVTSASALHGSVTINGDGSLSYSPNADYNGSDTISYEIRDNGTTNGVADPKSAAGTVSVTVTPVNDAPVADNDGPYTVAEGGTLNVTAAAGVLNGDTDVDSASLTANLVNGPAHAASFTLNADGSFSYVHDGSETTSDSFTYRASDGSELSNSVTVTINVTPVPEVRLSVSTANIAEATGVSVVTATLTHATNVDVLVTLALGGSASSSSDYAASATQILIPAGQLSGSVSVTAQQDAAVEGNETIVVSVVSATNTEPPTAPPVTITIVDDDTTNNPPVSIGPGCDGIALIINGSEAGDTIRVVPQGQNAVKVLINGQSYGIFFLSSFSEIIAYGKGGDDDIELAGSISTRAFLFGEAGNDRLKGGNGPNVLVGGDGDDNLIGSQDADVLIGGRGADRLVGNQGDDLLIAGFTDHDTNLAALCAILDEWSRTDVSYSGRANHLRLGGGRNGTARLNDTTAHDDGVFDRLTGSANTDWFFANIDFGLLDQITDRHPSELVDDID